MVVRVLAGVLLALGFAVPACAEPALWKVQGPHATVYLFGTVHVLRATTRWRTPKIEAAFASSGTLWEETPDAGDAAALVPLVMQLGLDLEHPLSAQLDDAGKAKLAAFEAKYNMPAAGVERFRPWLAAMTFSALPMKSAGYDPATGVDRILFDLARAQNKPVMGFETAEQQVHYFADMPQKTQLDYLLATLTYADAGADALSGLVDAWAAGDTAATDKLLRGPFFTAFPSLYQTLIVARNAAFAKKIEELLAGSGTSFVAVGAGHLVGPDSVQAQLAKDGVVSVRQ